MLRLRKIAANDKQQIRFFPLVIEHKNVYLLMNVIINPIKVMEKNKIAIHVF